MKQKKYQVVSGVTSRAGVFSEVSEVGKKLSYRKLQSLYGKQLESSIKIGQAVYMEFVRNVEVTDIRLEAL